MENYKKIYRFTISNEIKENKENGCISIQLDVCNCFTIKLYLDIATKNEELLYTFNFKENGKVEIIDYQEEKTLRWNEKNKKNIQEKLEKIIF